METKEEAARQSETEERDRRTAIKQRRQQRDSGIVDTQTNAKARDIEKKNISNRSSIKH